MQPWAFEVGHHTPIECDEKPREDQPSAASGAEESDGADSVANVLSNINLDGC